MKIKVCGMREPDNIQEVAALGPDLMGFIFYPRSPRYVSSDLPHIGAKKVGVFVHADLVEMLELVQRQGLDYVQLHSEESPEMCAEFKRRGIGVIKAFGVDADFDFGLTAAYDGYVDYFLFDTKGDSYGGHGLRFDWSLLKKYKGETSFFVAGGIDNTSVEALLEMDLPNMVGIDVNSKYEISPAMKDIDALKTLFLKVRNSNKR